MRSRTVRVAILTLLAAAGGCALITGLDKDYRETAIGTGGSSAATGVGGGGGAVGCVADTKVACPYGGDPKTKDVGVCHAGEKTCNATGQYDACKGEVLPAAKEECSNGSDDDCNGQVNDACPCTPASMNPCFSGDPKKADVGNCKSGKQTCNMDGKGYGPCVGEVAAAASEDCKKLGDEDCDGIACSDALWAVGFGDTQQYAKYVAADRANGDVYVAGTFTGAIEFGGSVVKSDNDVFLAKLGSDGKPLWAQSFGATPVRDVYGLAVGDSKGQSVVIAGYADFGSGKGSRSVAKFDPNGKLVWSTDCGSLWNVQGVAVGSTGDVYITGDFTGGLKCAGLAADYVDMFVMRVASGAGNKVMWAKRFGDFDGSKYPQVGTGIALDASDNVYLSGTYQGQLSFDGVSPIAGGDKAGSAFVAKLTSAGETVWAYSLGTAYVEPYTPSVDRGPQIAVDSFGGPTVVGEYKGTISGTPPISNGDTLQHAFVAKYGSDGKPVWLKDAGRIDDPLVVNDPQDLVVAGTLVGTANFGGDPLLQSGSNGDLVLGKLAATGGAHVWSKRHGAMQQEQLRGLALGKSNYLLLTGFFSDPFTMDGLMVKSVGKGGLFVAKVAP